MTYNKREVFNYQDTVTRLTSSWMERRSLCLLVPGGLRARSTPDDGDLRIPLLVAIFGTRGSATPPISFLLRLAAGKQRRKGFLDFPVLIPLLSAFEPMHKNALGEIFVGVDVFV